MDRSRSKRYYYDHDHESKTLHSRNKPRYGGNSYGGNSYGSGGGGGHHYSPSYNRRSSTSSGGSGGGSRKTQDPTAMVTTSYRILCHDMKAGSVIGRSGSFVKAIRQRTGAWVNVHEMVPGDFERIIEISDSRRRNPDGRMPSFSPAQEALVLIHDRIVETEMVGFGHNPGFEDESGEYGNIGGGGGGNRVVTRLVVSRMHVGCLMGKGGKIIEQMRIETKTHIRILPRDNALPRCVSMGEEIVQVVGDINAVKRAIEIISSRLRESQHRDRNNFSNRLQSTDGFHSTDVDFHVNTKTRRSSLEGPNFESRYSEGSRRNNYSPHSSGFSIESGAATVVDKAQNFSGDNLVFCILCPLDKIDNVVGKSDGIVDLLQNEVGVNVGVYDPFAGSDEHIIIISSDEGPDDELFPAQEALLHIQTRIVDLVPGRENFITTRLLLQSDKIGPLFELDKIGAANVKILPRENLPAGVSAADEILQIVGEIKSAREALVEVTSRVRSYIHREFLEKDNVVESEAASRNSLPPSSEKIMAGNGHVVSTSQSSTVTTPQKAKDVGPVKKNERREDQPSGLSRVSVPLVSRSTLEVVIPPYAASELTKKSRKLSLISELSGATVKLVDGRPDESEKIIQISGTPGQAERAQSLLQGFILSTEEDGP